MATNGILLPRRTDVLAAISETGAELHIAIHGDDEAYLENMKTVVALVTRWAADTGLKYVLGDSFGNWTRRYHESEGTILPYHSDPAKAWSICRARFQLFNGKLWKCPFVAYHNLLPTDRMPHAGWREALSSYRPLDASADQSSVARFLALDEEEVCGFCPERVEVFKPRSAPGPRGKSAQP